MRPVLILVAAFALVTALLAWSRWLAGRHWAAVGHLVLAVTGGVVLAAGWPLVSYLEGFERRAPDRPVADLYFERIGPGRYRVALTRLPSGRMQVVELTGDQWRLELQTLDWSGRAARLGASPRLRVDGLTSRPAPLAGPGAPSGVARRLSDEVPAPWLARFDGGSPEWLYTANTVAGPWRPMAPGARFGVRVDAAGTVSVEALNAAADDSLASL